MKDEIEVRDIELHADARGWVVNALEHLPPCSAPLHFHAVSIEPGCARGRHRHPGRDEHLIVLSGVMDVVNLRTGARTSLSGRVPRLVVIAPGVPHAFENHSDNTAVAICFSVEVTDPEAKDTVGV